MNKFCAAIIASAALTLTACGGDDYDDSDYDDYSAYENDSDYSDYESDIGAEALSDSWDSMSASNRQDVCEGYVLIPETIIDTIREGNEDYLTREDVRDFLDENC